MTLKGRDFLSIREYSTQDLWRILKGAAQIKKTGGRPTAKLRGKELVMIFQKPSTRTRISFEVAMRRLGGEVTTLNWADMQLGRGETIPDTARTLERYAHGIVARVYSHTDLTTLAEYAHIPVINALSDLYHPCQALADIFTIWEKKKHFEGLTLAWVGDGNNTCHSLIEASAKFSLNMKIATPPEYQPNPQILAQAREEGEGKIDVLRDPEEAAAGADVIYTDTFISMGKEGEREKRLRAFLPQYQVKLDLFEKAKKGCLFMHCLPAHRGEEVTDSVIDSPRSVVWDQAENRLHTQQALLSLLL